MDILNTKTTGEKLKQALSLTNLRYVWIQRVIGIPYHMYIISYDSRFPRAYLPRIRIYKPKTSSIKFTSVRGESYSFSDLKTLPPVLIEDFNGYVGERTIIIQRDIIGDRIVKKSVFECYKNKYQRLKD